MPVSTHPGNTSAQTWGIALDSSKSGYFSLLSTHSLSELVISARFLRSTRVFTVRPATLSKSIAEEFPVHRNLRDGDSNAQMPASALRSFHASTLRLKKCASQSAKRFGRPKPALTQFCH